MWVMLFVRFRMFECACCFALLLACVDWGVFWVFVYGVRCCVSFFLFLCVSYVVLCLCCVVCV